MARTGVARLLATIAAVCGAVPQASADLPVIRFWPDVFPCDGTLQACIDAAGPDDQIRIATDGPILESIAFSKPLSLVAQGGYHPVFSSGGTIDARTSASGDQTIRIEGLGFDQGAVGVFQASTGAATFQIVNNSFVNGGSIGVGSNLPGVGPISFVASGNTLTSMFSARISVGSNTTTLTGSISDNTIETGADANYAIEVGSRATVDVLRNRISGGSPGIALEAGSVSRVLDNLVTGQQGQPGALQSDGIDVWATSSDPITATIVNNTIANTYAGISVRDVGGQHAGIYCLIENNLITGNRGGIFNEAYQNDPSATIGIGKNLFFGNTVYNVAYTLGLGFSPLVADPLYVSSSDFHVRPGSPAIDAGEDSAVPGDLATDLDGNPRIQGSHVDIGAFEAPEPGRSLGEAAGVAALIGLGLRRRSSC
jgi:hypothetical protein